jgi:putative ABC transport system permease protein
MGIIQDLGFAFRLMHRSWGFTLIVIGILTLTIGANTLIFSLMNCLLIRPLPFEDSERLVMVMGSNPRVMGDENSVVSYPDYLDWKNQNHVFEEMALIGPAELNISGGEAPERISGFRVSESYFSLLRIKPVLGRSFLPQECRPGGERVAILSQRIWQTRFGERPDIIGQSLNLDGRVHTIVGVMPTSPDRFLDPPLWIPLEPTPQEVGRGYHYFLPLARLRPEVQLEQARAEMQTIAHRLEEKYPETNAGWTVAVGQVHQMLYGQLGPLFVILMGAVGCILLIASVNVANMWLAQAMGREREIAIRTALGATRLRLIRQLLAEGLLLFFSGGCLGLLLAYGGSGVVDELIRRANLPIAFPQIQIDLRALGFTVALSLVMGTLFCLVPAFQTSRTHISESLKASGGHATAGRSRILLKKILVVSEITFSLVLLISATLLFLGFRHLLSFDPGFHSEKVLTLSLSLSSGRYPDSRVQGAFYQQLLNRIVALPGIQQAGLTNSIPMGYQNVHKGYSVEGRPKPAPGQELSANYHVVSPGYFKALSIRLKRGRFFTEQDAGNAPPAVIINETLARAQWKDEDPMGRLIRIGDGPPHTIVGVIADVKYFSLGVGVLPEICVPFAQNPVESMNLVVKTALDPLLSVASVRREIQALDPAQPIAKIRTLEQVVSDSLWIERCLLWSLGSFAFIAISLAIAGIYGVISFSVSQRTQEIGIRLALGAKPGEVLRMILRQSMLLTGIGIALGLILSSAATQLLANMLYGVQPTDPAVFASVSVLLAAVAFLACLIPARRAAHVNPLTALRYE